MAIKLHGVVGSNATFRALATLYEKEVDFEFIRLNFYGVEHKSSEFLTRNPFGQVPAFEDGDLQLLESRAITKYVAEMYADKGTQLILNDPKEFAIQTVWMEVENQKFEPVAHMLVFQLCMAELFGKKTDYAMVSELEKKLADVLDVYERRLAKCKYLGGDSFTLADLHHLPNINYLMGTKVKSLFLERPYVSAWVTDIISRPSWVKVFSMLAIEGP